MRPTRTFLGLSSVLLGAVAGLAPARAQLTISNTSVTITPSTTVSVGGDVNVQNGGALDNQGRLYLSGDLNNSATVGTSTGTGLWQLNGTGLQTITNTGTGTLATLEVNNPAGATLASPVAAGTLSLLAGPLRLANNDLTLTGAVTNANLTNQLVVTNGTGRLFQPASTSLTVFPIGPADNTLRAASVTRAAGTGLYGVGVRPDALTSGPTGAPLTADVVGLRWNVATPDATPFALGTQWATSDELPSFDRTNATLARWNGTAYAPGAFGAATTVGSFYAIQAAGLTAGGLFVVADRQAPLPVVLTAFDARRPASLPRVELTWATASESRNLGFEVQRQDEGQPDFQRVGFVAGAGTSPAPRQYAFTDPNTFTGQSYYRLKQVDDDGTSTYSPVRVVAGLPQGTSFSLGLFPNPAHTQTTVAATGPVPAGLTLALYSADGRLVWQGAWAGNATSLTLPVQGLATGAYWLRFSAPGGPAGALKLLVE